MHKVIESIDGGKGLITCKEEGKQSGGVPHA